MQLADSRFIAASPEQVWTAILDPEVLKACIPGCESMTGSVDEGYEAVVVQKVGPVSARPSPALCKLSDIIAGQAVTHFGRGQGRRGRLCQGRRQGDAGGRTRTARG